MRHVATAAAGLLLFRCRSLGQVQDLRTQVHGFVSELGTDQPV